MTKGVMNFEYDLPKCIYRDRGRRSNGRSSSCTVAELTSHIVTVSRDIVNGDKHCTIARIPDTGHANDVGVIG